MIFQTPVPGGDGLTNAYAPPAKTWKHNWVIHPLFPLYGDMGDVSCSKCHNRKELYHWSNCPIPDPIEPGWEGKAMKHGFLEIPTIQEKDFIKGKDYLAKIIPGENNES